jgi:hypothetical protein
MQNEKLGESVPDLLLLDLCEKKIELLSAWSLADACD